MSPHRVGRLAQGAVDQARDRVARSLGAQANDILFMGSGTEANNSVVFEVARAAGFSGEIVVSALEHPSVLRAADRCAEQGMTVFRVVPASNGVVSVESVVESLSEETRLVCLMIANNEVGTLQPVQEVAEICRERGIPVLCDAVQGLGKLSVDANSLGVDFLTIGGHKFHGPLGGAALWVRPGISFEGWMIGGSQERHLRAGTVNVPSVVGLGLACELATDELAERHEFLLGLRNHFEGGLSAIPDAVVHCSETDRLPHTSNVALLGTVGLELLLRLDRAGFAVSVGLACGSGELRPSATLLAIGFGPEEALASIRVSFGMTNTLQEVDRFLEALASETAALRVPRTV